MQAETYYSSIGDLGDFVVAVIQDAAIIVGAKIGKILHEEINA